MCIDRGARIAIPLEQLPELAPIPPFESGGLTFEVLHGFRTESRAAGYRFEIRDGGQRIGTAVVVPNRDETLVGACGHMGCEVLPEFRKQGYTVRLVEGLKPVLRQHGIERMLAACDVGHESQIASIVEVGGVALGEVRIPGDDAPKLQFAIPLTDDAAPSSSSPGAPSP